MSGFDEYEAYTDQQLLKFIIKELIEIKEILKDLEIRNERDTF